MTTNTEILDDPHAAHVLTDAGELLDADGSHCVQCTCWQCVEVECGYLGCKEWTHKPESWSMCDECFYAHDPLRDES